MFQTVIKRFVLKMDDLTEKDNGNYMCVATNVHGEISRSFQVEAVGE